MSGTPSPVDEPPGKDGVQAPNPPDTPPIPEWEQGENPPGTNPPVPTPDTGTTYPPGTMPGVVVGAEEPPPAGATAPPTNVDVPHVSQTDGTLNCTMGNWTGEPTGYSYQWKLDDIDVGVDDPAYIMDPGDVGMTATCIVTAHNAIGSTVAPPSDGVVVVTP